MNMTVLIKKCTYGLLLIATTIIGLVNFGYCEFKCNNIFFTSPDSSSQITLDIYYDEFNSDIFCFDNRISPNKVYYKLNVNDSYTPLDLYEAVCIYKSEGYTHLYVKSDVVGKFSWAYLDSTCMDKVYTSLKCQTEYNLIPISSVDQNYCVDNNLCPSTDCPDIPGTGGNRSALYINNIQYNGAPTIRVTIPEEIERDNYTDEEETNIDIIGYGYDQDKMQQMVNTQYYKPTAEEMSGLMGKIADFLPLIAVALLITRLRRVIKKVF